MRKERGASLIALLLVLAIAGLVMWLVISRFAEDSVELFGESGAPLDETKRTRTLADMQAIGRAIDLMRADKGSYPANLAELEAEGYLVIVPPNDGWGNAWTYTTGSASGFTLVSLGSDAAAGPMPPQPWTTGSYACDLVMKNGQMTQAPAGR